MSLGSAPPKDPRAFEAGVHAATRPWPVHCIFCWLRRVLASRVWGGLGLTLDPSVRRGLGDVWMYEGLRFWGLWKLGGLHSLTRVRFITTGGLSGTVSIWWLLRTSQNRAMSGYYL